MASATNGEKTMKINVNINVSNASAIEPGKTYVLEIDKDQAISQNQIQIILQKFNEATNANAFIMQNMKLYGEHNG